MTTTTRNNHLADDLAAYMAEDGWDAGITLLDEALAAERRAERKATVERIRERIDRLDYRGPRVFNWDSLAAILDEEAARV